MDRTSLLLEVSVDILLQVHVNFNVNIVYV